MKKSTKKKAFTLTELLVVVIVVGVLAAVVLPKFSKVMETRKTTEAEELMAAVRTEQEKRCALDKNYLAKLADVQDILPSNNTKNFSYTLTSTGMEAQSKGKYGYTLKMPSYADGRICCESQEECAKLNKAYPLCTELIAMGDYQSGAECAGEAEVKQCSGPSTRSCGCNNGGTQTRTCDTSTGVWNDWSGCSVSDACKCKEEDKPANKTMSCNGCGTKTASYSCDKATGEWKLGAYGSCSKTYAQCLPGPGPEPPDPCKACDLWLVGCSQYAPECGATCRTDCGACSSCWDPPCESDCGSCECGSGCGGSECGSGGSECGGTSGGHSCLYCSNTTAVRIKCAGVSAGDYVDSNCNSVPGSASDSYTYKCHTTTELCVL